MGKNQNCNKYHATYVVDKTAVRQSLHICCQTIWYKLTQGQIDLYVMLCYVFASSH